MEEHGAKLNPPEAHPEDPWTAKRRPRERETAVDKEILPVRLDDMHCWSSCFFEKYPIQNIKSSRKLVFKSMKMPQFQCHFIPRPGQLHFRCCWLDVSNDFHGCKIKRTFVLTVFTLDDTVSLTEETREYEGQLFLRRINLPRPAEQGQFCIFQSWQGDNEDARH